jgi:hypothetical protein
MSICNKPLHYLHVDLLDVDLLVKFWWELSLPQQLLINSGRHTGFQLEEEVVDVTTLVK